MATTTANGADSAPPEAGTAASVQLLVAEVRTLMVGKRQVTLSVWRQLDELPPTGGLPPEAFHPFGRVRDSRDTGAGPVDGRVDFVGVNTSTGALVRSYARHPYSLAAPPLAPFFVSGLDSWAQLGSDRLGGAARLVTISGKSWWAAAVRVDGANVWFSVAPAYADELLPGVDLVPGDAPFRLTVPVDAAVAAAAPSRDAGFALTMKRDEYLRLAAMPLIVLAGLR